MIPSGENTVTLPAWLDTLRQPDELQASAYEACPADFRAGLKTAIAFAFHLWGNASIRLDSCTDNTQTGFRHRLAYRPASWVLAFLAPGYSSPARFIAALMPAILAGVENIIVVSQECSPSPSLCTAFELAGIEDIFVLPSENDKSSVLLRELRDTDNDGRVLLFPAPEAQLNTHLSSIRHCAETLNIRLWSDTPSPRLSLLSSEEIAEARAEPRKDILAWAHGDACIDESADGQTDALFTSHIFSPFSPLSECKTAPLVFGPGLEACWIHPLLTPDYFRTGTLTASFRSHV